MTTGWAIPPKFDQAAPFSFAANGLALAESGGKWGYIDARGEWAIPPKFDDIGDFADNGLAPARSDGKYGYVNARGEWVIPPKFYHAGGFAANGLAPASDGKYGYIDARGEWVIPPKFDDAGYVDANGLADARGEWVIPPKFDDAGYVDDNGLALAKITGKWGFINTQGEWAILPKFDEPYSFDANGCAWVEVKGERRHINTQGEFVVCIEAAEADPAAPRWEERGDRRVLTSARGVPLLYIESVCDTEVAKNIRGEIIWPPKSAARICEDATVKSGIFLYGPAINPENLSHLGRRRLRSAPGPQTEMNKACPPILRPPKS